MSSGAVHGFCHPAFRDLAALPEMLSDLRFHFSWFLISSCVFSRSGGTETELADLGPLVAVQALHVEHHTPVQHIIHRQDTRAMMTTCRNRC